MSLLVDTSVWSLALRRGGAAAAPEVAALRTALEGVQLVVTTGIVVQELLQVFQSCRRHALELLTTDGDFTAARVHVAFGLWSG